VVTLMSGGLDRFEDLYRARNDPWNFAASPYERARYATTIDWLGGRTFSRAFEPACSVGELTALLAERCAEVVACDVSATACAAARRRTAEAPYVDILHAAVPEWWPDGTFDLVVLSEIGYYSDPAGVEALARRTRSSLGGPAVVVAVHWLGRSADHRQHGSAVHDQLEAVLGRPDARCDVDPLHSGDDASMFVIERWITR
jgi:SAM-dependent methyltransferase